MKISLEINNVAKTLVKKGFFAKAIRETFAELNYDFIKNKEIEISIALITKEDIKKLNKKYRQHDSPTDILSFPEFNNIQEIKKLSAEMHKKKLFLGELILCYDDIKEYAEKKGLELEKEFAKVVSHGILHLVGFKHGKKMFSLQQCVADKLVKTKKWKKK